MAKLGDVLGIARIAGIMGAKKNAELIPLCHIIALTDCEIEFVTSKDPIGHKTYCRSASLILLKAIYDVAGQENIDSVVIHYSVGSGYYFTMN